MRVPSLDTTEPVVILAVFVWAVVIACSFSCRACGLLSVRAHQLPRHPPAGRDGRRPVITRPGAAAAAALRPLAPMLGYHGRELGAGGEVQLGEDVREVRLHRPARYVEPAADLGIGQSLGDQLGDTALRWREAAPAGPRPAAGSPAAPTDACLAAHRLSAGEVADGVEVLVDGDRLFQEPACAIHVAVPGERGSRVLGGKSEFQGPRSGSVDSDGRMQ